jgi:hypothetical protein
MTLYHYVQMMHGQYDLTKPAALAMGMLVVYVMEIIELARWREAVSALQRQTVWQHVQEKLDILAHQQ